ncbi:Cell division protein FtsA [Caloramator mitchellensis]|uniref:Cell division protein FtsA n=1 Tax=Caloramator mitchellensis TaxID=908809 RepID=A0A0R3JTD9_CALMK|nr:cell division FtsA domain-containing protein [Caloramator mitchellensis]KRQ86763.1 Cell division protein FtsA [Caloramator mitchellensis]
MNNLKFALDIGTRTVVGVAYTFEGDKIKIIDEEIIEHRKRAMLDGQVHDISAVSEVVLDVKKNIESRLGVKFDRVSIAAAGRILKTNRARAELSFENSVIIDDDIIKGLKMQALQIAYSNIDDGNKDEAFYCVGYSIVGYLLNDYVITSLEGHKGNKAAVEILATFLPQTVVDSLYSVIEKCNMEVESLTLEPIAALNAVIPKDLRLLNLALVDIGAGTSDIAITKEGTVVAYGMVPFAGDEVTEAICHHLVVDFNTAEMIKLNLNSKKKTLKYVDVLGNKKTVNLDEIKMVIEPVVENMASLISGKIIELNGKSPNAIFLVGGGSQSLSLSKHISKMLNLPEDRVAVRGIEAIKNVIYAGEKLKGPECVTPIGIALNNANLSKTFMGVFVNGKKIKLYNSGNQRISDALALAGFKPSQLIGRSGKSLSFRVNGELRRVYGESSRPCMIIQNGKDAHLMDVINDGDEIFFNPAVDGRDAKVKLGDLLMDGEIAKVNGRPEDLDYEIKDGDEVEIIRESEETVEKVEKKYINISVNGDIIKLEDKLEGYIFVDIFNYIDLDYKNAKNIKMLLNGQNAAFTDKINDGDEITIKINV